MTDRLDQEQVRQFALSLPEAQAASHHGTSDLRVRNKIFATLPTGTGTVNLKVSAEDLDTLVRANPEAFERIWGGRVLSVHLDRAPAEVVLDLVRDAWALTAPKSLVKREGRPPGRIP